MQPLTNYIKHPSAIALGLLKRAGSRFLSDKTYLKLLYRLEMGKRLDLKNPQTFSEKIQWLKLYDRKLEYTTMVDKYAVKKYVADKIGEQYIIPTLGVWDRAEDIDWDSLPNQFVLKTTHGGGGGGVVICKDKAIFDKEKAIAKLKSSMKSDIYKGLKEWPYKNVPKRIIAEKYMEDESGDLNDYKFSCFDGYVDCVMTCTERQSGETKFYFFDKEWKLVRLNKRGKEAPADFTMQKPTNIDEMFEIASKLSCSLPFSRVDLYSISGKTYFGEITFFPASGLDKNLLPEAEKYWGNLIKLPIKTKK